MPLEPNSETSKVTPLSQAVQNRRSSELTDIPEDQPVTENRLKEILSEFVSKPLVAKITRLENSINRMVNQFEAIHNGEAEDASLRVTTAHSATDIALAGVSLSKEEYYPYTCNQLAILLNVRQHDILKMIRISKLRGSSDYHIHISEGKSGINKWSEKTYQRLKSAINSEEYPKLTH